MNEIITIAGIGIVSAGFVIILKQYRPEFAFGAALSAGIAILIFIISLFSDIVGEINEIISLSGIPQEKFKILFRCLGISLVAKIASEVCSDCGQNSISSKIDFAGKAAVLITALPLYSEITEIIKNLLAA